MSNLATHEAEQAALTALCDAGICGHRDCMPDGGKNYLVAVCDVDLEGTHHVSSHVTHGVAKARELAIAETRADWGKDDDYPLHVLYVMATPVGVEIEIVEYDEEG